MFFNQEIIGMNEFSLIHFCMTVQCSEMSFKVKNDIHYSIILSALLLIYIHTYIMHTLIFQLSTIYNVLYFLFFSTAFI